MNVLEPDTNLPRQLAHALEDEGAEPLDELSERAPYEGLQFSDFERNLSEWSFGFGVAWALARVRDPFLSSARVASVARAATREAWRLHTGHDFWPAMMFDRGGEQASSPGGQRVQIDEFMARLGNMRARPGGEAAGESSQAAGPPGDS
jgi:hypothetical protein